jgi:hypothetical protein
MRLSRARPEAVALALGLTLAPACGQPARAPATAPTPPAAQARVFFVGPEDFREGRVELDLDPAPGGTTTLIVVPALGIPDFRADRGVATREMGASVSARAIDCVEEHVGHLLPPERRSVVAPEPPALPATSPRALPDARVFRILSAHGLRWVGVPAHLSYAGQRYAFYDDDGNEARFDAGEYRAMSARLDAAWPSLVGRFGAPTDRDRDGHVLVLVSRAAVTEQPGAQMAVDRGTMAGEGDGELVVAWSLDGFDVPAAQRAQFVDDYFPRTIMHETVHLAQLAAAARAGVPWDNVALPDWVTEGQAQLERFHTGLGLDELWSDVRSDTVDAPFFHRYALGALPFRWAERFGPDAQRAFLRAAVDPGVADPFATAFGVPEPLLLAELYASLRMGGTPFGHDLGLELPLDDAQVRLLAPPAPVTVVVGAPAVGAGLQITGHAVFEVAHLAPARVVLAMTGASGAYVLVVRR